VVKRLGARVGGAGSQRCGVGAGGAFGLGGLALHFAGACGSTRKRAGKLQARQGDGGAHGVGVPFMGPLSFGFSTR